MPDTTGRPGRNWPAEVKRAVHAISGGRCMVPGCPHKVFRNLAHRVPHCQGGSREIDNIASDICPMHHGRYDRGELRIEGTLEAPRFYDARGRRILPNGRVEEEPRGSPEEGVEGRERRREGDGRGPERPQDANPTRQAPGPPTDDRDSSKGTREPGAESERGPPA